MLVAFLVEFALSAPDDNTLTWVARLGAVVPEGERLGQALCASGDLRAWAAERRPVSFVLDTLLAHVSAVQAKLPPL